MSDINIEGLKELAWLYLKYADVLNSFPSSLEDLVEAPRWFKTDEDDEDTALYQMISRADKAAKDILKEEIISP